MLLEERFSQTDSCASGLPSLFLRFHKGMRGGGGGLGDWPWNARHVFSVLGPFDKKHCACLLAGSMRGPDEHFVVALWFIFPCSCCPYCPLQSRVTECVPLATAPASQVYSFWARTLPRPSFSSFVYRLLSRLKSGRCTTARATLMSCTLVISPFLCPDCSLTGCR